MFQNNENKLTKYKFNVNWLYFKSVKACRTWPNENIEKASGEFGS